MADNTHLYGFRIAKGHEYVLAAKQRMRVASGYSPTVGGNNVALSVGDPVIKVNDGTVAIATAGVATYGVVVGIGAYFDGTRMTYGKRLPFNTVYGTNLERQSFVHIVPVQSGIFEVDCDDKTTATTQAAYTAFIGENVDLINVGDTTAGTVNPMLDISTHNVANTLAFRIVDIAPTMAQLDFTGLYVKLYVTGNLVQDAPYTILGI